MYTSAFCRIYNEYGWNAYPEVFVSQLLEYLSDHGFSPKTHLDLGCGTGVLCGAMREAGMNTRGVDLSAGMIDIARTHFPQIPFETGDMTQWIATSPVELVTCTGDAVNHLPDLKAISHMFSCVRRSLSANGLFIFDLLDEAEIPCDDPFEMDDGDVHTCFRTVREGDDILLRVMVTKGMEIQVNETIRERLYPVQEVCALLEQAGFHILRRAHRLNEAGGDATTWYIVAQANQ